MYRSFNVDEWLLSHAEKGGIIGHLLFDLFAILRGWVVIGTTHAAVTQERDHLREILDESNQKDREKLERVESRLNDLLESRRNNGH